MRAGRGCWLLVLLLAGCASSEPDPFAAASPALRQWTDAQGIAGFDGLRWGMKEADVRRLYPAFEVAYETRNGKPKAYRYLEMKTREMGGCVFSVMIGFFNEAPPDDRLAYLAFRYSGDQISVCSGRINAGLERAFGLGVVTHSTAIEGGGPAPVEFPVIRTYWDGPQLSVAVEELHAQNSPLLVVDYTHTGAPGTFLSITADKRG